MAYIQDQDIWINVRAEYEIGAFESVSALARNHGVSRGGLQGRANREGWVKGKYKGKLAREIEKRLKAESKACQETKPTLNKVKKAPRRPKSSSKKQPEKAGAKKQGPATSTIKNDPELEELKANPSKAPQEPIFNAPISLAAIEAELVASAESFNNAVETGFIVANVQRLNFKKLNYLCEATFAELAIKTATQQELDEMALTQSLSINKNGEVVHDFKKLARFRRALSLEGRATTLHKLISAYEKLVGLERQAYGLEGGGADDPDTPDSIIIGNFEDDDEED